MNDAHKAAKAARHARKVASGKASRNVWYVNGRTKDGKTWSVTLGPSLPGGVRTEEEARLQYLMVVDIYPHVTLCDADGRILEEKTTLLPKVVVAA